MTAERRGTRIAIIGIGCRFPGHANSPQQFWNNLIRGVDTISEVPKDRFEVDRLLSGQVAQPGTLCTRWGGFSDFVDAFDAGFFGISPREAARMDPQQRILLELAWDALQDGGQVVDHLAGASIGVFVGNSGHDYGDIQVNPANGRLINGHTLSGTASSINANRVSYVFDFRGPSLAVDTACSSSLTAVHLACRSLASGECEMAVAGGVNLLLTPEPAMAMNMASMLSPDGRCKTFDARANGFVRGEGAGIVVLKPLDQALLDGDPIYAVIRGTAVNQDGRTVSMTLPSLEAQQGMLRQVLADSGVQPGDVQYVEAHGTGTAAGDPVEAKALGGVLSIGRRPADRCLIGSVKTNIGHLEAAAGIAGLIKTALALKHRLIPPNLHFERPNPGIPFEELLLRVPTRAEPWPACHGPAIAGVNSFGFGGSNAHALLEEAPAAIPAKQRHESRQHVLVLSARSADVLRQSAEDVSAFVQQPESPSLPELCFTAAARRTHHEHRLAVIGDSAASLADHVGAFLKGEPRRDYTAGHCSVKTPPKVAFVFPGMGAQQSGMGRRLLHSEPVFRTVLEECDQLLRPLAGWGLLEVIEGAESVAKIENANVAQVANFAVQAGLVALWSSWGIAPDGVIGHSTGEVAAAYAAGALTLEDGLRLAYHRGRLLHGISGRGRMLAAGLSKEDAALLIAGCEDQVAIAAHNSPLSVTFSGEAGILDQIAANLQEREVFCRFVPVAVPYHSPYAEPLREDLLAALADLDPKPARIPVASATLGAWARNGYGRAPYWWKNIREQVRFADAVDLLIEDGYDIFLEIGPHPVLGRAVLECLEARHKQGTVLPSLRRGEDDCTVVRQTLGTLYSLGCRVDWTAFHGPQRASAGLPQYPWQRERHWLGPEFQLDSRSSKAAGTETRHPLLGVRMRLARPCWECDLQDPRLAYLQGHVVQDSPIYPAAAYIEMALAASADLSPDSGHSIRQFAFHKMLPVAAGSEPLVQLVCDSEGSFSVHSAADRKQPAWTLHATGRIQNIARVEQPQSVSLAEIQARCSAEVSVSDWYQSFDERGLSYSGVFRGVQALWKGNREALGQVGVPPEPVDEGAYRIHPALLDSAIQVTAAALYSPQGAMPRATLVPASIERVESYRPAGKGFWSHAYVRSAGNDFVEADVRGLDDDGNLIFGLHGLRCVLLASSASEDEIYAGLSYQYGWEAVRQQPVKLTALPSSREIVAGVSPLIEGIFRQSGASPFQVEPQMDALAAGLIRRAMERLGCDWRSSDDSAAIARQLRIAPARQGYFGRLLQILREHESEPPAANVETLTAKHPEWSDTAALLRICGESLPDVLTGKRQAHEVLFAPESIELLAAFYRDSPAFLWHNRTIAEVIARTTARPSDAPKIRVLEVGAGTGGTTASVLAKLAADTDYVFSDRSPFFLSRARSLFGGHPGLSYALFDVEKDSASQALPHAQFDVILASDVIHAAGDVASTLRNIHRLLAPNGLLILFEVIRAPRWVDVIFGMFQGWWTAGDSSHAVHSLRRRGQWVATLGEAGFDEVTFVEDPEPEGRAFQSILLARRPLEALPITSEGQRKWVILADGREVGTQIATGLQAHGDTCVLVPPGEVCDVDDLRQANGIVHLGSLGSDEKAVDTDQLMEAQKHGCHSVLSLTQTMAGFDGARPQLWIVTAGAQCLPGDQTLDVSQSTLWGLGRVILNEQPSMRCRLIDVSPTCHPDEIKALIGELIRDPREEELAFRGQDRFVKRLRKAAPETPSETSLRVASAEKRNVRLRIGTPGAFGTLRLEEMASLHPGPGELLLRVKAAGLNFRDIMVSSGLIPPPPSTSRWGAATFGYECAGVVLACGEGVESFQPGDEVVAAATAALGSHTLVYAAMTVAKPPSLSFDNAAGILTAFITAHYALNYVTRIAPGERVLIHAGTGGVGLAAIQICQRAGAEILATAGTEEKRAYLKSLGVSKVMNSRSLDFAEEVMDLTAGEGVDVILNSLAGEAITKGLSLLRTNGRFLEIGKRDLFENSRIGLAPFVKGLSFSAIDLDILYTEKPEFLGALAREVMADVARGALHPLPTTFFPLSDVETAFRFMAQAKHIGKIVITVDELEYAAIPLRASSLFRKDGAYLITGGLGGFALAVARWMAAEGAGHIVLMSRTGSAIPENQSQYEALLRSESKISVVKGDVSQRSDVDRILSEIRAALPPLRGVFHAAMVLEDKTLMGMSAEEFDRVLAPKIAGAWNLHQLTRPDPIDLFVMFSSVSSVLGSPLQGNYSAANAFLDELALLRQAEGLAALSVNWGPIAETGYVARHPDAKRFLDQCGIVSVKPDEAIAILKRLLQQGAARGAVLRLNPSNLLLGYPAASSKRFAGVLQVDSAQEARPHRSTGSVAVLLQEMPEGSRPQFLQDHVLKRVSKILSVAPSKVSLDSLVTQMGLDSLMAVELQSMLKLDFGIQIPAAKLLQGISIRQLAERVAEELKLVDPEVAERAPEQSGPVRRRLPLGIEQRRFWFLDQLDPASPAYNISMSGRFTGSLNVQALESALNEIIRRHEALRATFDFEGGEPVQWIAPELKLRLATEDLSGLPGEEREEELQRRAAEEARRGFHLQSGPLIRAKLLRLGDAEYCLLLTIHHIVLDVWSLSVIWREFGILYRGFDQNLGAVLPDFAVGYSEYIARQKESLIPETEERQLAYWRSHLAGLPTLGLPADRPRPARRSLRGTRRYFEFPEDLWRSLEELSRREGVTPFMTLLSGYQTLLHRYSGQDTICVGTPVSRRHQVEAKGLVGCFVNTLAMRTDLSGNPSFRSLLAKVRETVAEAHAHQDVPFERVVEAVQPERDRSVTPIFQALLVLHNIPFAEMQLPGLTLSPTDLSSGTAVFDLILVIATEPRLRAYFEYDADLFDESTIEPMIGHFRNLLDFASRNPECPIGEIPLLSNAERENLLPGDNAADQTVLEETTLHGLFEAQVRRTPDAPAVEWGDSSLTYVQLNRAANRIARTLRSEGVGSETIVAICADRSAEAIAGILGILKAGGAFLPLDPAYPVDRLGYMLSDARPAVVLTQAALTDLLTPLCSCVLLLDAVGHEDDSNVDVPVTSANLAYVIYTSGSTGEPKGVMIEHGNISNQVVWRHQAFPLSTDDVVLHSTSLSFDPSVWECLGPLTAGARVVIAPQCRGHESSQFPDLMERHQVTVVQGVPSMLRTLAEQFEGRPYRSLRHIFCGGEELSRDLQELLFSTFNAQLHNLYGTTETSIDATYFTCPPARPGRAVPIGRPICNSRVYILDRNLEPVPTRIPGELFIGGRNVGRGYLNRPELTDQKFLSDPFSKNVNARLYRTGDLARWGSDGTIEFLGRLDRQVKVRGFRIEPGEVEVALCSHPDITSAVVKMDSNNGAGARLQAWVVPRRGTAPQMGDLRDSLRKRLPGFMIPSEIFCLDALPLTPDGKTDYLRLHGAPRNGNHKAPMSDPLLQTLARMWEELLGQPPLSPQDNFFELGGHSLLSVQLLARIRRDLGTSVPVAEFLLVPTLQGMADALRPMAVKHS